MLTLIALSTPVLALLTFFMRKGAPVEGRSSAPWWVLQVLPGAHRFAFHRNHDDPLYVAAWYGGARSDRFACTGSAVATYPMVSSPATRSSTAPRLAPDRPSSVNDERLWGPGCGYARCASSGA